jgi:hypothetical protein
MVPVLRSALPSGHPAGCPIAGWDTGNPDTGRNAGNGSTTGPSSCGGYTR